jgi:hypothetical protein
MTNRRERARASLLNTGSLDYAARPNRRAASLEMTVCGDLIDLMHLQY